MWAEAAINAISEQQMRRQQRGNDAERQTDQQGQIAAAQPSGADPPFLDFRRWPLAGASAPDKHLLRLRIKGKYPQWNYWMQLTFMSPVPWEADAFYSQPGMNANGLSLVKWPVGTGPFVFKEWRRGSQIVFVRNSAYWKGPVHLDEALLVQRHPGNGPGHGHQGPIRSRHEIHKPSAHLQPLQ